MMDSLRFAIENRVNKLGVAETVVQQIGERRLLVEIPQISDLTKAKEFLGDTAELQFKKEGKSTSPSVNSQPVWVSTD